MFCFVLGKGSFGEIFLASDEINTPVTSSNAKYVVKIEPHSNGPLFVEIHCLLNTTSKQSGKYSIYQAHVLPSEEDYNYILSDLSETAQDTTFSMCIVDGVQWKFSLHLFVVDWFLDKRCGEKLWTFCVCGEYFYVDVLF